ncbi:MAG TPA: GNAT family N-acetyltransferase [Kofleriaceae bacterium]|nr:GNAT family N-acetyltransferase [Kofleriaceae bacterium]
MALTWYEARFDELAAGTLYDLLALRSRVFVVEQRCAYDDLDGLDRVARHVWASDGDRVAAYLRILPAGVKYAELGIGRVVVAPAYRGTGLGRELMRRGIAAAGGAPIRLGAQAHLERFYAELGFQRASDVYDEDGIPHVEMVRPDG